ncbi:hypothetical protein J1N35_007625 [Gossypium stocksii]|uniref:Uncharacterized protein n=1 Tax=Gossypium stocksii TaxID=47602 RepID=A0A9D3W795_9ROSI|nr:hypothetical protein J1N35_007625 [Gossypium stocksii]
MRSKDVVLRSGVRGTELQMGKGDASNKKMANVPVGYDHVAATHKFKRHKVSAVRDFPPGCGRGTASDFGLSRQIAVDQSSQGKCGLSFGFGDYEYLVLYVIRCVLLPYV